ncbi:ATP-grasp fold amidoligase family protein [Lysinibacillus sp. NPDC097214]|uniref:ATP-grasp fold amidoligase family protein n=1 Tax=Lysinibacillus sp. NPDC097214 TaxID=3390584 RepID=UPI003D01D5E2
MSIRNSLRKNQIIYRIYLKYKFRKITKICNERKAMSKEEMEKIIEHDYYSRINESIDWEKPEKYTDKIQWRKLNFQDQRMTEYSDKILVREYVKNIIGEDYLIPILGEWDSFEKIDFDILPNSFVLKTNHGSGTNIIVKDKSDFEKKTAEILINGWLNTDFGYSHGLELHYSGINRKIFSEQYIETKDNDLEDYKFLCFDGKAYFCWVDVDRYGDHRRNVYDLNWNLQPWGQSKKNTNIDIPKPENFSLMITLAEKLAAGFSHVRVDLYNIDGRIYFGEMTFTNGSGYDLISPREFDYKLGDLWKNYRNS